MVNINQNVKDDVLSQNNDTQDMERKSKKTGKLVKGKGKVTMSTIANDELYRRFRAWADKHNYSDYKALRELINITLGPDVKKRLALFAEVDPENIGYDPATLRDNFAEFEQVARQQEPETLQSWFETMTDREGITKKEKKTMAWGPARFHNDVLNLAENRAPASEINIISSRYQKLTIIASILAEKGLMLAKDVPNWQRVHETDYLTLEEQRERKKLRDRTLPIAKAFRHHKKVM